jgi:hypothetical protein
LGLGVDIGLLSTANGTVNWYLQCCLIRGYQIPRMRYLVLEISSFYPGKDREQ